MCVCVCVYVCECVRRERGKEREVEIERSIPRKIMRTNISTYRVRHLIGVNPGPRLLLDGSHSRGRGAR